jgi:antitoxin MazE
MQVSKWGNSLAVRLPVALVQELGIQDGDELQLKASPNRAESSPSLTVTRLPSKSDRLMAMRKHRAPIPTDFVFDRDEANTR